MFKRLRWLVLGGLAGVGLFLWAQRQVRAQGPTRPEELVEKTSETLRDVGGRLREAIDAGRVAMREEQARLERELLGRNGSP